MDHSNWRGEDVTEDVAGKENKDYMIMMFEK